MFLITSMLLLQEAYPEEPGLILGHFSIAANNVTIQKTESTEGILEKRNRQCFLERQQSRKLQRKRAL